MPLIQWSDRFSVGVPSLDAQHKQLIGILNELHEAMTTSRGAQVLPQLVNKLGQYAATHLDAEERMLRMHGYPDFTAHKAEHDAYVKKMKNLALEIEQGKMAMTVATLSFLQDWWSGHILKSDQKYSAHMKSRKAA